MVERATTTTTHLARRLGWTFLGILLLAATVCLLIMLMHFCRHYGGLIRPGRSYVLDGVHHTLPKLPSDTPLGLYPVIKDSLAAQIKDMFMRFQRVCIAHGMDMWLAGGTLLGYVRHQGFIPWDDDMDLHMKLADKAQLLGAAVRTDLEREGLALVRVTNFWRTDMVKVVALRTGAGGGTAERLSTYPFLDVLFEGRAPDGSWGTCADAVQSRDVMCQALHPREQWNEDDIFPLQDGTFENLPVRVPHRPVNVLEAQYGKRVLRSYHVDFVHWIIHFAAVQRFPVWPSAGMSIA